MMLQVFDRLWVLKTSQDVLLCELRVKGDDSRRVNQVCQAFRKPDLFTQQIHLFTSSNKHALSAYVTPKPQLGDLWVYRVKDWLRAFRYFQSTRL